MAYFLRTTDSIGKAYGGFQWPMTVGATVTAPDWDTAPECGNGLHGLLNGEGGAEYLSIDSDAIWWIVEADDAVDLGDKHKFQSCKVVAFGSRDDIVQQMKALTNGAVHYCTASAGHRGTATAGHRGTATVGHCGTATVGYCGTATAGDYGTATVGYCGTATAGGWGIIQIKHWDGDRYRLVTGYIGEDGLKPDTPYKLDGNGKFVEVTE